jgi:multidrug efflux pump
VWLEGVYLKLLTFSLRSTTRVFLCGHFCLLIFAVLFFMARDVNVSFFPENEPAYINVITEMPIGTDIRATNDLCYEPGRRH